MSADRAGLGCDWARQSLWPPDVPRPYTEDEERAREHVEGCAACRAFFRRDRAVVRAVARRGAAAPAPRELRERVYQALARERALGSASAAPKPEASRSPLGLGVARLAGVALLATGLLAGSVFLTGRSDSAEAYVEDFVGRAVEEDAILTSDPTTVSRFFMKEMGVRLAPVELEGAELSQAMICLIRGERAAMVEYEWRGHTVAHYRLPLGGPRAVTARTSAMEPRLRTAMERGVHVVRWKDGGFEHAVVSELPSETLLELVRGTFLRGG